MTKILLKILKFFFSNEREVAPGVFYLGGYLYENRNKPTTPPPEKPAQGLHKTLQMPYNTLIHTETSYD
jgi:hypothetical protein